jgi:hypothetical protein
VIAERDATMVLYQGPVRIDWIDVGWKKGYRVTAGGASGSYC